MHTAWYLEIGVDSPRAREEVMAKVRVIEQERGLIYIPNFNNRILLIFLENTRCHRDDCKFYLIVRLIYTVDSGQPGVYPWEKVYQVLLSEFIILPRMGVERIDGGL